MAEAQGDDAALRREVREIPLGIRRLGEWSWRLIAIAVILWIGSKVFAPLATVFIPVLIALLLTALLYPLVSLLTRYTFLGRAASSVIVLLGLIAVVIGMFTLAGRQLIATWPDIQQRAVEGFFTLTEWARDTFNINTEMVDAAVQEATAKLQQNADSLISGALSTAMVVGTVFTGLIVCLFSLFFFLYNGATIWRWAVGLIPASARITTHEGFRRGWKALSAYVRTQIIVAAVDAVGIAAGMLIVGLGTYAVPIWLLVFLFSFIPLLGAVISGAIAVLLALVLKGWVAAIIVLATVLIVQQLESNVLQPILMGKAVELHPLGVFLGVAAGATIAGVPGALFAIPVIAFVNSTLQYLTARDPSPELGLDTATHEHFRAIVEKAEKVREERKVTHSITRTADVDSLSS